ncbi:hypothetical protein CMI37_12280, partial [Candidatus Pacearchaeota archaeon]|nr:hypothetical protein [Candidatus Pacearchaeota archaeon]
MAILIILIHLIIDKLLVGRAELNCILIVFIIDTKWVMPHNRYMAVKKKSNAGRKKGSVSFCMVPLSELNTKLSSNAIVIISRKFACAMGIEGQPIIAAPNMIVPFAQAQVAQSNVQVETFEKKESKEEE